MAAPLVLWVFWFGPLGPVRRASIDKLTKHAGVNVTLLTDSNYTRVGTLHPLALSPALSKVHLSDYLRAYVMHHYGGAYQDVKPTRINWRDQLSTLNHDPDSWFVGAEETPYFQRNPAWDRAFGEAGLLLPYSAVRSSAAHCVTSNGYYAVKPYTPLTREWLALATLKMTVHSKMVRLHPAPRPRCCTTYRENGYPIYWTELHGDLLHPLQVKHCRHVTRFDRAAVAHVGQYRDAEEEG
jgi:hypothetical protein